MGVLLSLCQKHLISNRIQNFILSMKYGNRLLTTFLNALPQVFEDQN